MDTKYYTCHFCHKEFDPKRRYVQKFCSDNCRSKAHHQRKKKETLLPTSEIKPIDNGPNIKNKVEGMSLPGIGNATAGALAAGVLKNVFTDPKDRPATKGDILALRRSNQRYQSILNLPGRPDGTLPYFDMETKMVVYLRPNKSLTR
ncbi:hypothetical protein A9200_14410 [Maribacter hydrothermalis]|uniref:Uncharacterized protein n=2 Tax=Maribacter hydrothermalis TaxID=1836467 RepID=A0A1B7ZD08_9FLAO|nr:hypothetical protein BTR34_16235 [Maribacter hydrothermalis]OBR41013.1 hypothetical protein A9200_14410 [Maribacter hydrothermalis]